MQHNRSESKQQATLAEWADEQLCPMCHSDNLHICSVEVTSGETSIFTNGAGAVKTKALLPCEGTYVLVHLRCENLHVFPVGFHETLTGTVRRHRERMEGWQHE